MNRLYFCCFDRNYVTNGVALYRSLKAVEPGLRFAVFCLDDFTYRCMNALKALGEPILPVALDELEKFDARLPECRANRSRAEYIFTLSPFMPRWIFAATAAETAVYLDADLLFFSTPEPLFAEFEAAGAAVLLTAHGFVPELAWRRVYGIYNVSFQIYRRGAADAPLAWWSDRCAEWCGDRLEFERFADQKYLDKLPRLFSGVIASSNPGAGIAPWNWRLRVGVEPVFYHFQGFRFLSRHLAFTNLGSYGKTCLMPEELLRKYYRRYARELLAAGGFMREVLPGERFPAVSRSVRTKNSRLRELTAAAARRNLMLVR